MTGSPKGPRMNWRAAIMQAVGWCGQETFEEWAAMLACFYRHCTAGEVADALGTTSFTVRRDMKRAGYDRRPPRRRPVYLPDGRRLVDAAREAGVSYQTYYHRIRRARSKG